MSIFQLMYITLRKRYMVSNKLRALGSALADFGFMASQFDPSLFIRANHNSITITLIYVNDIIITSSSSQEVSTLISSFAFCFSLKDIGPLHYFSGIRVTQNSKGILLSQPNYIHDLLILSKMDGARLYSTPHLSQ